MITTTNSLSHLSPKLLLHSSNLLTVARMEVTLGADVYYIVSMTTTTTNSLRQFSLKLLLHSSNLLTVPRMEMNMLNHFHDDQILFEQHQITSGTLRSSNLLTVALMEMKLGIRHRFHDNHILYEQQRYT